MSKNRPFAYDNANPAPPGAVKYGDLVVGDLAQDLSGNLKWIGGADEMLGYIIAYTGTVHVRIVDQVAVPVGFWRSSAKTEASFLSLVLEKTGQTFSRGDQAKAWLESNGYWTSYGIPIDGLTLYYDFNDARTYKGSGTNISSQIGTSVGYIKNSVDFLNNPGAGGGFLRANGANNGQQNNVGDRIDINTTASGTDRFSKNMNFSFVFWVNPGNYARFFSTGSAGTGTGNDDQCIWQFWCTPNLFYWWNSGGGGTNNISASFVDLTLGQWNCVVVTYKYSPGGNNTVIVYNNGVQAGVGQTSDSIHSAIDRSATTNLQYTLGGGYWSSCYTENGPHQFGMFLCYNTTLTAQDASDIFETTRSRFGI